MAAGAAAKTEAGAVRACEGGLCGIPGKTCFVAGTLVGTERGNTPIKDIKVGDKVWSRNLTAGKDELQLVVKTYVRHAEALLKLTVAGSALTTTADHPFMVRDPRLGQSRRPQARRCLVHPHRLDHPAQVRRAGLRGWPRGHDLVAGRRLARAVDDLTELLDATRQIAVQTRQRIAGTMPDGATRRVSLHDPDARPIAKGRLGKPVESATKPRCDNDDGVVLDHTVEPGTQRLTRRRAGHQTDRSQTTHG